MWSLKLLGWKHKFEEVTRPEEKWLKKEDRSPWLTGQCIPIYRGKYTKIYVKCKLGVGECIPRVAAETANTEKKKKKNGNK